MNRRLGLSGGRSKSRRHIYRYQDVFGRYGIEAAEFTCRWEGVTTTGLRTSPAVKVDESELPAVAVAEDAGTLDVDEAMLVGGAVLW
jgi:hypothetical protein